MADSTTDSIQYVLFRLGDEEFGLPVSRVSSIIRYEQPTPVPQAPTQVDGVINVRGRVIPVVNLRRALSGIDSCPTAMSRIVVTESDAGTVGIIVDAASEVATISADSVQAAPESVLSRLTSDVFEGVADLEGRLVILLRLEVLVPRASFQHPSTDTGGLDSTVEPAALSHAESDVPDAGTATEGETHA